MNERLKAILLLPASRKVLIGLAAGALAYTNKKFSLGIPDDTIHWLIGVAGFVILGIALEDSANTIGDAHIEASNGTESAKGRARDEELLRGLHAPEEKKEDKS